MKIKNHANNDANKKSLNEAIKGMVAYSWESREYSNGGRKVYANSSRSSASSLPSRRNTPR